MGRVRLMNHLYKGNSGIISLLASINQPSLLINHKVITVPFIIFNNFLFNFSYHNIVMENNSNWYFLYTKEIQ